MKKLLLPFLLLVAITTSAQLRLPAIFTDHMVIQRESVVPIWGWNSPGWEVKINTSWDTVTVRVITSNTAQWKAELKTPKAGGPYTITLQSGNEIKTITDVLSGEVWLCSGQSNMEWPMAISDGKALIPAINDPAIRLMHIPKSGSATRQERGEGQWTVCDKNTISNFSAVAYFFGKKLNTELNVPIGLINASWGGSNAEAWTPNERVVDDPVLAEAAKKHEVNMWWPNEPGTIFNSMITPLVPFKIGGVIWYQGESNTAYPQTYKQLMEALIIGWRKEFKTEFPFYYVQIAPFSEYGVENSATRVREQQVKMLQIPKTGMVVISDHVDNVKDIHPVSKKPVGERLANMALSEVYGKKGIAYLTPLYKSMKVEKDKIRVMFGNVASLVSTGGAPTEFMIAGEDKKFYPAKAKIEGNTVVVSAKEVKRPVAVRFAWGNGSIPNLFSSEGLPVSVFRTDDWE